MSGRGRPKKSSTANSSAPRSHPAEQQPSHRLFLIRSLERNDVELAALGDLNRSLHAVKLAIQTTCGTSTLLDLGEGRIALKNGVGDDELQVSDDSVVLPDSPAAQHLCVDFLLRMQLRTRLLNRLIRRLQRLAHAMDGNAIEPPGPPRYGDLRLHVEPAAVAEFMAHWKQQEVAIKKISAMREGIPMVAEIVEEENDENKKDSESSEQAEEDDEKELENPESRVKADGEATQEAPDKSSQVQDSAGEDINTKDELETETSAMDFVKQEVTEYDAAKEKQESAPTKNADKEGKEEEGQLLLGGALKSEDAEPLEACYDALRDYNYAYEKLVDPDTGNIRYTILDQEHEEDYVAVKFGAGVGAVHRSMSAKEKESEFRRWKTSLLSRIPDQPTFEELGMKNRVFLLEERRKRAREEEKEDEEKSPSKKTKASDEPNDEEESSEPEESDAMDVDDEEDKAAVKASDVEEDKKDGAEAQKIDEVKADGDETKKGDGNKDGAKESNTNNGDGSGGKNTESEKTVDSETDSATSKKGGDDKNTLTIPVKPISFVAVPSFHDQDLKRITLIHAELMAASIQDHARQRLEEVTRDYNAGKFTGKRRENTGSFRQQLD